VAAASAETIALAEQEPSPKCGAKTRHKAPCKNVAGYGTSHLGYGNCKFHGGNAPNGVIHAARVAARHMAVELDVEPHDALLWCVKITAGEVRYFTEKISGLEAEELVVAEEKTRVSSGDTVRETSSRADLHLWVHARAQAVDRLARYSKMAIDAGVEERRVRLAETLATELSDIFAAVFAALRLTPDQLQVARPIVHRHLLALEGGTAA
jgi:hypothetical protein